MVDVAEKYVLQNDATPRDAGGCQLVGQRGLEPVSKTSNKTIHLSNRAAKSGAVGASPILGPLNDPALREIITRWKGLDLSVRTALLTQARAHYSESKTKM
jgi:hypothetical protein